jgi:hypothetical protein
VSFARCGSAPALEVWRDEVVVKPGSWIGEGSASFVFERERLRLVPSIVSLMPTTGPRRSRRVLLHRALFVSVLAIGGLGCAVVAGVDFDSARLDPLSGFDAASFVREAGGGTTAPPEERLADGGGCASGQKVCNGACVPTSDPAYGCGAAECTPCSLAHTTGVTCGTGGACIPKGCESGFDDCDHDPANGCEADLSRAETCRACTTACTGGMLCAPTGCVVDCPGGLVPCSGACVDTTSAVAHCGGCGNACPGAANADPTCVASACRIACRAGFGDCANNPPQACPALPKWFVDSDGDGVGSAAFVTACNAPAGHVGASGDCLDSNPSVRPGAGPSTVPFAGPAGPSFDYDCSGTEVEDPPSVHYPGMCEGFCTGGGAIPATPARAGAGVNNYCGSPSVHICADIGEFGGCISVDYDAGTPIPCR